MLAIDDLRAWMILSQFAQQRSVRNRVLMTKRQKHPAPQQGQEGICLISQPAILSRMPAVEPA
jgi:hypothetical protein